MSRSLARFGTNAPFLDEAERQFLSAVRRLYKERNSLSQPLQGSSQRILRRFLVSKLRNGKNMTVLRVRGFEIHKGFLDVQAQMRVLDAIRAVVADAPLFQPDPPYGKKRDCCINPLMAQETRFSSSQADKPKTSCTRAISPWTPGFIS